MSMLSRLFGRKKLLEPGAVAPDFELKDQNGQSVRLSRFQKKSCVILYFYPKDNTYHCIAESCAFRDSYETFKENGVEVIGVSSDSTDSHQRFADQYRLPFILLSDKDNHVRDLYGVPNTLGVIPGRVTFAIDKEGIIRNVFNSQFNPHSHVEESLKLLNKKPCPPA